VSEQHLAQPAVPALPAARPVALRVLLGVASWTFGAPGAALLAFLLVAAPDLAGAWAWIFGGFWVLVAAAGSALDLAGAARR
jgi:hypothetical protein